MRNHLSQNRPIVIGSGGGENDLFLANEDMSVAKRSLAVINTIHQLGGAVSLPKFRLGIDMDLSHAMAWFQNEQVKLPIATALACWFMTGPIDDERTRVWLFNLHRWACKMDCERSLSEYVAKSETDM